MTDRSGPEAGFSIWVTHSLDTVFKDTPAPAQSSAAISLVAAGGEYESAQVVVVPHRALDALAFSVSSLAGPQGRIPASRVQCRFVGYQWVEKNSKASPPQELTRQAPAWFPDPLLEEREVAAERGENQPILVTVSVPRDTAPGLYRSKVRVQGDGARVDVPLTLEVLPFNLPEKPTLWVTNWFSHGAIANAYGVPLYSEEFWRLLEAFARDMAEHRQNVVIVPPDLVDVYIEANGGLTFDFPRFDRWVGIFEQAGVAERLEIMHMGGRTTGEWECPTFAIGRRPALVRATGERQDIEIEQFLPGLVQHLKEKGWLGKSMLHVADEPIPVNVESWQEASRRVHAAAPELPRIDAIHVPGLPGDLEIWVPQLNFFDESYETFRDAQQKGECELWFYTAWVPQGKYPNRLMDFPLIKPRLLHWVNYLYGATGYLHWGLNWWDIEFGHFSPGDEWIVYPGKNGPRGSLRWEAMRDGLEDYEYFKLLEGKRGEERAMELGRRLMRSITDYDRDPGTLLDIRRQMAAEIAEGSG
ncbi:MAG: DUF4091 domain-containing protein [Armatimonadota bacterium]|nr:MAG: DUF4091 domain-containing protein [Armatimonadota bacterium]